jgi:aerobic C4-dicarboxylate transport protein
VDADPAKLDTKVIQHYVTQSQGHGLCGFFLNVIPSSVVDALRAAVLFSCFLFGAVCLALSAMGERGRPLVLVLNN